MNNEAEIVEEVWAELNRARAKFPTWPDDPIHAAAVVAEESGELVQAALQACYEQKKDELSFQSQLSKVRREAIQTAAMAIRFLISMDQYGFKAGRQHKQAGEETAVCRWSWHPGGGGYWETSCVSDSYFTGKEGEMKSCHSCGRSVEWRETAVS